MTKFYGLSLGLLLLCFQAAIAQTKEVTGKVTDGQDGSPLSGVTVKVKGATATTLTAPDGAFKLNAPESATTLVFTYVGYRTIEMPISGLMNVTMAADDKSLSEVVVVGYGQASKREVTGAITKVNGREVENIPLPSFESALQGKAAGLVVESGSGKLGQGIKVRIRGTSSISAASQPLYVVDGLPVISTSLSDATNDPTNPLADINPNDIESIEILKDASAAAIYGARASNGVVLITTKKGKSAGKTIIELNLSSSISNPTRKRGFLNTKEYVELLRQAARNDARIDFTDPGGTTYSTEQEAIDDYTAFYEAEVMDAFALGTDWRNNAVDVNWEDQQYNKNANANQVDISLRGGNDKTRFFVSGFYNTQEAIVINNKFLRYGGRLNIDHNATNRLSIGLNLAVNRSQLDRVSNDNAFSTPGQLVAQLPFSPLKDPTTGELNSNTLYSNGLFDAQYNSDKQVTFRTVGNAYANYKFSPSLSFRSELGTDLFNLYQEEYQGKLSTDGSPVGKASNVFSQSVSLNTNNYFTYTPQIGNKHKLATVLGMSYLQNDTKQSTTSGENFPSDAIKNLSGASDITGGASSTNRYTFLSYFARANYSYLEKYLLSVSVRADGSSRFGSNNRYGWFPAGSIGWILSDENFLSGVSFLSYLKLRASYGLTGNAEIPDFRFLPLYGISNYPGLPGFVPAQLGNPDLKWENSKQADLGLEFGFFNNRLTGEVDVYHKKTTDLLLNVNIPLTTGYASITRNLGTLENKGLEIVLNSKNVQGALTWTTSFNIAFNKNKVTNINGQVITSGSQRAVEGEPIGVFWLPKFLGVDPATGDAQYADADGKPITSYSAAPFQVVGKANPDFTGGLTNTFTYKGFDLNVLFTFVSGNEIYNGGGIYMSTGFSGGIDNQEKAVLRAWKNPGDITDVPRASLSFPTGQRASSRWIYDGSYIRMRNISLGYTIPASVTSRLKLGSARIYVAGLNLLTFTDYPADPEVNTATIANIAGGTDFYTIPQPKTITAGITVRF
jgi:TonB-dependent starch-binding outer membrane protein SusC